MPAACAHKHLELQVPEQADFLPYFKQPPHAKRIAAATPSGRVNTKLDQGAQEEESSKLASTFPAPLVLPDDLLDFDPDDPPQSLRSWIAEKMRNPLTARRKTIYVAQPPDIDMSDSDVCFMENWISPSVLSGVSQSNHEGSARPPKAEDVCDYLRAFYHPLPVRLLPQKVAFVPWKGEKRQSKSKRAAPTESPAHIGLQVGDGITRIRARPCPDEAFPRQLNLNDILDAAMAALPADAYALIMLINHDTYEDEEDDFCCGRAYGSSRIAMVSSARYHPALDAAAKVDRAHMWPASHCKSYVEKQCGWKKTDKTTRKRKSGAVSKNAGPTGADAGPGTPIRVAVDAALAAFKAPAPRGKIDLDGLWFSRVARTASHELGHCFCLGHCPYYACVMQGTACVAEDLRQPPYLCPVCLAKVTKAVRDVHKDGDEKQYQIDRYAALADFCSIEKWAEVGMFAGYRAWLEKRIEQLSDSNPA